MSPHQQWLTWGLLAPALLFALLGCGPAPSLPPSDCAVDDADCDGAPDTLDCAPDDPRSFLGAEERCDERDNDCDGAVDEDFDQDADGVATCAGDCDDADATSAPGLPDRCADGVDNDCNGLVDDGPDDDVDGDGVCTPADCDDDDDTLFPGAAEVCDGVDQDCDDAIDEGFDGDGDGALDGADPGCAATYGDAVDCDDADPAVSPSALEICDGLDQDCDGAVDSPLTAVDDDADGVSLCAGEDCDDGDATAFPGGFEIADDADDDCDGVADDGFAGVGSVSLLTPTCTGQLTLAGLGLEMSTAGDMNGDGRSDVVVTAPLYANGKGRIFVLMGTNFAIAAPPSAVSASITMTGLWEGETLGSGIALVDLDGDGFDDLVVGSPEGGPGATPAGQVRIFWGGAAFVAGAWDPEDADVSIVGSHAVERCGTSVAALGDVNGDGLDDLALGCPWYTTTGGILGRTAVFLGRTRAEWAGITGSEQADSLLVGGANETKTGSWVSGVGDLNDDGYDDLAVGSPLFAAGTGRVGIKLGGPSPGTFAAEQSMDTLDRRYDGLLFDALGTFVRGGDVNGDGVSDLLVGAPEWSGDTGRMGVLFGEADLPPSGDLWDVADLALHGSAANERVGVRAATGDLDGDGVDDLLLPAPGWDGPLGGDQGRVGLFLGPLLASGTPALIPDAAMVLVGEAGGDALGTTLATLPDVNGDGAPDAWLASPYNDVGAAGGGRLHLLLGMPP